jgi:hypothetical protein
VRHGGILVLGLACLVTLSACDSAEPLRDSAYFEGLGFEKTFQYLQSCADEKNALLAKQDAEGLDRFAKSSKGINCRTSFNYAAKREAEAVLAKAKLLRTANSEEELKQARGSIESDVNARWGNILKTFHDWKSPELSYAYFSLGQISSSRLSDIMIAKIAGKQPR